MTKRIAQFRYHIDSVMDFKDIKKILVIKFRHIGDVLLTIPTIRALKETFSNAAISVLVNSGTEDVLSGNPVINELMVFDRTIKKLPLFKRYLKEVKFLKEIRAKGFDMTVDLTGGDRSAVMSFISGARYRLSADFGRKGFIGKRYLYTHLADVDKQKHMALQNLDVVRNFGITTDNIDIDFFIPEEIKMFVRRIFEENDLSKSNNPPSPPFAKGGDTPLTYSPLERGAGVCNKGDLNPPLKKGDEGGFSDKIIHVHPTSRWLFKCWKDEYMAEIIDWLIDKGVKVVVTSAPDSKEIEKAKRILSLMSELRTQSSNPLLPSFTKGGRGGILIDLCGKTTIKELAAVSEASDLFIGVDSAPMHIAAAVGTPVIALFGPTGKEWMPYGKGHIVISKDMLCKPCKKGMCEGIALRECMTAIKPDDVKGAVNKILKKAL